MIEIPTVRRYRRTGLDVEAYRFVPLNQREVADWCGGLLIVIPHNGNDNNIELVISLKTIDGEMLAHLGDYIIKIKDGFFYPCNAETFEKTYEEIVDGPQ
jgi:hypothetical protein